MADSNENADNTRCALSCSDIAAMERNPRALLINSLPGYKPGMLVGTCDREERTNLAIISSHFHLGSNPPLLALILRPSSTDSERHTLANILATQNWTLNSFSLEDAAKAHQTSAPYPRETSEFDACQFGIEWKDEIHAPFIEGAALQIACALREHHPLSINGTHLLIGEIAHLSFPREAQREDGSLELTHMGVVAVSGLDTYLCPSGGLRFAAAEVDLAPRPLSSF